MKDDGYSCLPDEEAAILRGLSANLDDAAYWLIAADFFEEKGGHDALVAAYRLVGASIEREGPKASALKILIGRHRQEVAALRERCSHPAAMIKVRRDHSGVGKGSIYPSIHIVCRNCGKKKVMFIDGDAEASVKVARTLDRQEGIKDQRLDCHIQYDWELE